MSTKQQHDRTEITFSPWRHGGWYTSVRTASGASGCVSRNYPDKKWRIVCDPRPDSFPGGSNDHTYATRTEAALAEQVLAMDADARLGAAFRALHEAYDEDADDQGVWDGSAADICSDVFHVFTSHGLAVR